MDYDGIMHCFIFDPINNENDKRLLDNLKQYEDIFNEIIFNKTNTKNQEQEA